MRTFKYKPFDKVVSQNGEEATIIKVGRYCYLLDLGDGREGYLSHGDVHKYFGTLIFEVGDKKFFIESPKENVSNKNIALNLKKEDVE